MVENQILYQTRLEQLEFDEKDDVVSGHFIDYYGWNICKGDEYIETQLGVIVHYENLERFLDEIYGIEIHTKK